MRVNLVDPMQPAEDVFLDLNETVMRLEANLDAMLARFADAAILQGLAAPLDDEPEVEQEHVRLVMRAALTMLLTQRLRRERDRRLRETMP